MRREDTTDDTDLLIEKGILKNPLIRAIRSSAILLSVERTTDYTDFTD